MPEFQNECKKCHRLFIHEVSTIEASLSLQKIVIPQLCQECQKEMKNSLSEWVKPSNNGRILMEKLETRY